MVEQSQDQHDGNLGGYHDGHGQEGPLLYSFICCTNWEGGGEGMQKSTKCELECVTKLVATNIPKSGATVLKIPIEA